MFFVICIGLFVIGCFTAVSAGYETIDKKIEEKEGYAFVLTLLGAVGATIHYYPLPWFLGSSVLLALALVAVSCGTLILFSSLGAIFRASVEKEKSEKQ